MFLLHAKGTILYCTRYKDIVRLIYVAGNTEALLMYSRFPRLKQCT